MIFTLLSLGTLLYDFLSICLRRIDNFRYTQYNSDMTTHEQIDLRKLNRMKKSIQIHLMGEISLTSKSVRNSKISNWTSFMSLKSPESPWRYIVIFSCPSSVRQLPQLELMFSTSSLRQEIFNWSIKIVQNCQNKFSKFFQNSKYMTGFFFAN